MILPSLRQKPRVTLRFKSSFYCILYNCMLFRLLLYCIVHDCSYKFGTGFHTVKQQFVGVLKFHQILLKP